ncbi:Crp/Fnr family transcriptional regulator [Parasphingorhabdus halotolerans]|uniref:Crp/Fnr family transcriptional regulator n=1 Tax=Parasphingorhabdus halotolerans TaxID=2725558 RepID=A0A6H2DKX6_9SPHN|nr:Crp/Fnr family transcriptional regulator [Parasphingorhabdus halotolerans]QJB68605.1 Crp/Fnr family transcriptional regulator [Parasphingorhabdus halotolerans]
MNVPPPIGATGFISGLPDDVRRDLLARGHVRMFAKGQSIQQRGDQAREFWYVQSGSVQIGRYATDGRLTLFALLGPGETFGELAFLGDFPRTVDAIAGSETELVRIGEAEFQSLLASDGDAARLLFRTMALTVQEAFNLVEASRNLSTEQRLLQALVRLCGHQESDIFLPVTQQELADLVRVSRISVGKALGRLEKACLLSRRYGGILIDNKVAIESMLEI